VNKAAIFGNLRWTIGKKIPALMVVVTALSCGSVAFYAASTSFATTEYLIGTHLSYVANTKRDVLLAKLDALKSDVASLATSPGFVELFDSLSMGFNSLASADLSAISAVRTDGRSLEELRKGPGAYYVDKLLQADEWMEAFAKKSGFTDVTLIDNDGFQIFSMGKRPLGPLSKDDLVSSLIGLPLDAGKSFISSFGPPTTTREGIGYIVAAVPNPATTNSISGPAGFLVVSAGTATLDAVMQDSSGFGPGGEAIVSTATGELRSRSRFDPLGVDSMSIIVGKGKGSHLLEATYRGQKVLAALAPLTIGNEALSVIALEPQDEVLQPATDLLRRILLLSFVTAALTLVFSVLASKTISRPISKLVREMRRLANGDISVNIGGNDRHDEIGDMSRAVLVFKENAQAKNAAERVTKDLESAAEVEREATEAERRERLRTQTEVFNELGESLSALAGGVLTRRIQTAFPNEYAQIKEDFNAAVGQLHGIIATVRDQADAMATITTELHGGSRELASTTETQAIVLDEAVKSLKAVSADINRTATAANEADRIVKEVHFNAASSDAIVSQALQGMSQIEDSSRQISTIVSVIDEIAFQTNLLALNAGVEASRAGEAGRGFTVVASEVRALAMRSAEAAKEVKDLIATSSERVQRGTALVTTTSDQLKNIASKIAHIESVVSDIASAAAAQARHVEKFGGTIKEIDQATQRTAAMAEQSSAACHLLENEATNLRSLISVFKLEQHPTAAGPVKDPFNSKKPEPEGERLQTMLKRIG